MQGGLLQETGQHSAAIAALERVLALEPTAPEREAIEEKIAISRKELRGL